MEHYIYEIHFLKGPHKGCYYIGKRSTKTNPFTDAYTGSGKFCKRYFEKYGAVEGETYEKVILEFNLSRDINAQREDDWIGDAYKTDPRCMNFRKGGEGGAAVGHKVSEKNKKRLIDAHLGIPLSEERKKALSDFWKGKPSRARKMILQYDLNGVLIKEWDSMTEAVKSVNGYISSLCKRMKMNKPYKKYVWKYKV